MGKNKNKGFSLVELIIVIAIIAVLVSLLVPQFIVYVEKSKLSNDLELADTIHNVIVLAVADENIKNKPINGLPGDMKIEDIPPIYDDFINQIKKDLSTDDLSDLKNRLKSKAYSGQDIWVSISQDQKVTIKIKHNIDIDSIDDIELK